jgi:hypothetical protein
VPVIVSGGLQRRRARPLPVRAHRRRRGHARPRLARQPVAVRAGARRARRRADAARRSLPSWLGDRPRRGAPRPERAGRYLRKFYPWYVERWASERRSQDALSAPAADDTAAEHARLDLPLLSCARSAPPGAALSPVRLTGGPFSSLAAPSEGLTHAQGRHPHPRRPREAQGGDRVPLHRPRARSPSASRRRASSATSPRTPSTTTPRTSRRCSRRGSPSSRTSCARRR